MISGRRGVILVLDTNAYVDFVDGQTDVAELVQTAEQVLMSVIVIGELLYGFFGGTRFTENMQTLQAFLENPHVSLLPVTATTSQHFGEIANTLKQKGTPIPTNDVWIAAQTRELGATLLSRDKHFQRIPELTVIPLVDT